MARQQRCLVWAPLFLVLTCWAGSALAYTEGDCLYSLAASSSAKFGAKVSLKYRRVSGGKVLARTSSASLKAAALAPVQGSLVLSFPKAAGASACGVQDGAPANGTGGVVGGKKAARAARIQALSSVEVGTASGSDNSFAVGDIQGSVKKGTLTASYTITGLRISLASAQPVALDRANARRRVQVAAKVAAGTLHVDLSDSKGGEPTSADVDLTGATVKRSTDCGLYVKSKTSEFQLDCKTMTITLDPIAVDGLSVSVSFHGKAVTASAPIAGGASDNLPATLPVDGVVGPTGVDLVRTGSSSSGTGSIAGASTKGGADGGRDEGFGADGQPRGPVTKLPLQEDFTDAVIPPVGALPAAEGALPAAEAGAPLPGPAALVSATAAWVPAGGPDREYASCQLAALQSVPADVAAKARIYLFCAEGKQVETDSVVLAERGEYGAPSCELDGGATLEWAPADAGKDGKEDPLSSGASIAAGYVLNYYPPSGYAEAYTAAFSMKLSPAGGQEVVTTVTCAVPAPATE